MRCEQCNGDLMLLGTLGNLNHFRCRDCGWDQSAEREDDEPEVENDDPYGGDDSRADADLLGEQDGYNDEDYSY